MACVFVEFQAGLRPCGQMQRGLLAILRRDRDQQWLFKIAGGVAQRDTWPQATLRTTCDL